MYYLNTLYYKLKKLISSGLIVNYYRKSDTSSEYSFYKITIFGKKILKQLDIPDVKKRPVTTIDKESYSFKEEINKLFMIPPLFFDSYMKTKIKRDIFDEYENERRIRLLKEIIFFEDNWHESNKLKTENRWKMELI